MAGKKLLIVSLALAGMVARAEEPISKDKAPAPKFDNVRRAIEELTPEQRKQFHENFLRWSNLPPEEKRALREANERRREKMEQEMRTVMEESGLPAESPERRLFFRRYMEERRKIEEQLRREMEEKRQALLKELKEKLKAEVKAAGAAKQP